MCAVVCSLTCAGRNRPRLPNAHLSRILSLRPGHVVEEIGPMRSRANADDRRPAHRRGWFHCDITVEELRPVERPRSRNAGSSTQTSAWRSSTRGLSTFSRGQGRNQTGPVWQLREVSSAKQATVRLGAVRTLRQPAAHAAGCPRDRRHLQCRRSCGTAVPSRQCRTGRLVPGQCWRRL